MVVIKKENSQDKEKESEESPRGADNAHGTHETENSIQEQKVAREADGSGERYGNEWE